MNIIRNIVCIIVLVVTVLLIVFCLPIYHDFRGNPYSLGMMLYLDINYHVHNWLKK
jgi:hypothetical protein